MSVASGRPPMRHVLRGLISALVLALPREALSNHRF